MENGPPQEQASLYSPLDPVTDEIRLLTLKPYVPDQPLQCALEKASLQDLRPEYTDFVVSHGLSARTLRQCKETWAKLPTAPDPLAQDRFLGSVPSPDRYRFA
jgi:hypothetical protein